MTPDKRFILIAIHRHIFQVASSLFSPLDAVDVIAAEARCPDGAGVVFPDLTTSNATNEADEH